MLTIITLLIVLTLSFLIIRIATTALCYTGISKETASFQARSAFTGVGFATAESEKIVNHPVRRKILSILMVMGNAGIVTTISTTILTVSDLQSNKSNILFNIFILFSGLSCFWFFARSGTVDKYLSKIIRYALKKYTNLDVKDYNSILHLTNNYQVTELQVQDRDWIINQKLKNLSLKDEGILILGIERKTMYIGAPNGETSILSGDNLILYGRASAIESLDTRKKGFSGDVAHKQAVQEQEQIEKKEIPLENF